VAEVLKFGLSNTDSAKKTKVEEILRDPNVSVHGYSTAKNVTGAFYRGFSLLFAPAE
jgi:hypothetical protein